MKLPLYCFSAPENAGTNRILMLFSAISTQNQVTLPSAAYHSINVMGVRDANFKILKVVAKWLGSSHDSFVFSNSRLYEIFDNGGINVWNAWRVFYNEILYPFNAIYRGISYNSNDNFLHDCRNLFRRRFTTCLSRFPSLFSNLCFGITQVGAPFLSNFFKTPSTSLFDGIYFKANIFPHFFLIISYNIGHSVKFCCFILLNFIQ